MPYSKSTQKKYGDNPLKKSSAFKMTNVPYPSNRKGKINPNSENNTDLKNGRSKSAKHQ